MDIMRLLIAVFPKSLLDTLKVLMYLAHPRFLIGGKKIQWVGQGVRDNRVQSEDINNLRMYPSAKTAINSHL